MIGQLLKPVPKKKSRIMIGYMVLAKAKTSVSSRGGLGKGKT